MTDPQITASRRVLFVHAHPDDETIACGATMARYAAEGAHVTLLTCTLGEEGEILVPYFAQLAADQADQLGGLRVQELDDAMTALGVTDHRYLGGPGRFRDSGMMDMPANKKPRALWLADSDPAVFDAAVAAAVEVVREVRPQVIVTSDDNGDYGHPDHIMAHRVATAAAERAADPSYGDGEPWRVAKVYWVTMPKSRMREQFQVMRDQGFEMPFDVVDPDDLPFGVDDDLVTTEIDGSAYGAAKLTALGAHRTQITVDGPFFALSNRIGQAAMAHEFFRLVTGTPGPDRDANDRENDLFSGIVGAEPSP